MFLCGAAERPKLVSFYVLPVDINAFGPAIHKLTTCIMVDSPILRWAQDKSVGGLQEILHMSELRYFLLSLTSYLLNDSKGSDTRGPSATT